MRAHPRNRTGVYISRVPLIVADILLVYITWANISSRSALIGINLDKRLSLSDILFRNGMSTETVDVLLDVVAHDLLTTHRNGIFRVSSPTVFSSLEIRHIHVAGYCPS